IQFDKTALEPRVGLAYKILGSDKTVLRAGYAIFHDSSWSQGAQGLWQNPPFLGESDSFNPAGCAFVTSYCATVLGKTPALPNANISNGFQALPTPQNAATFPGSFVYMPTNIKHGMV